MICGRKIDVNTETYYEGYTQNLEKFKGYICFDCYWNRRSELHNGLFFFERDDWEHD